ncbi:MAG: type 4a pilus biogenesis protein PilO [bacterium]|nr:type 4a pilus biogenesis protein PilO [bacterium]
MTPLTSDEKKWLIVALVFMAIIGYLFYMFVWKDNQQRIAQLNQEIYGNRNGILNPNDDKALQNKYEKYKEIVEGTETQTKIAELTAKISLFEQRLPEKKDMPKLLTFFRQAADDSGTKFVSINALASITSEYYIEIPFSVVVKAKYHPLGQYINKTENSERFMRVDDIDIKSTNDETYLHEATMKISTYMFNQGG